MEAKARNLIFTEDEHDKTSPQDWNLLAMCLSVRINLSGHHEYDQCLPQLREATDSWAETAGIHMGMRSAGELKAIPITFLATLSIAKDGEASLKSWRMFMTQQSSFYTAEGRLRVLCRRGLRRAVHLQNLRIVQALQEMERKQLIEAMAMVFGGVNGAFLPYVMPKSEEWLDRLLDSFPNIRSPEQLRLSEEERQMAQMQSQMQQMMLPFLGGGGNEQPALGEKAMRTPEQLLILYEP
jgi:hypothetical protein